MVKRLLVDARIVFESVNVSDSLPETIEDVIVYNDKTGEFHCGFFEGADERGRPCFHSNVDDTCFYPEKYLKIRVE